MTALAKMITGFREIFNMINQILMNGEQRKKTGQQRSELCNIGHAFHLHGMDAEKNSTDAGRKCTTRQPQDDQKEKNRIENVEKQIGHMKDAGMDLISRILGNHAGNGLPYNRPGRIGEGNI